MLTNIENIHDQLFQKPIRFLDRDFRASGTASQLNFLWFILQVSGVPLLTGKGSLDLSSVKPCYLTRGILMYQSL